MLRIVSAQVKSAQFYDDVSTHEYWLNPDFNVQQEQPVLYRLVGEDIRGEKVVISEDTIDEDDLDWEKRGLERSFPEFWKEFQLVSLVYEDVDGVRPDIPVQEYDAWVASKMPEEQETAGMPITSESPASPPAQPMVRPFSR